MSPFRAVLFDFFGTLTEAVRRGPAHARIARDLGCDPPAMTAALDATFRERARGAYGDELRALRAVCRLAGGAPSDAALAAALPARRAAMSADLRLRPDAVATLAEVRGRGLRTGLVSDCAYELPVLLPGLPVAPLLEACVYSVHVGRCKPDPAIFLAACARLRVAPRECLYVGDGGGRELTGATALGMTAVRLAAPDLAGHLVFAPDDFAGPAVDRLGAVPALLDRAAAGGAARPGVARPRPPRPRAALPA
ncbi:beta-phosphoglucomutase [Pilimelia anulata]|uniref:Beta-phosphoglucomutase n=1 Tax=Pilimelia anulata TaxID=53371 RepID=A0A8J3B3N2_9ACTN|nr:HAD family hydrolase [Pilimelia anulata]GGJ92072.1 beta-phosphoglucomutase [Pilimelia anulata]